MRIKWQSRVELLVEKDVRTELGDEGLVGDHRNRILPKDREGEYRAHLLSWTSSGPRPVPEENQCPGPTWDESPIHGTVGTSVKYQSVDTTS